MQASQPEPQALGSLTQHQFPTPMESFQWLTENIPQWLEKLDTLAGQVRIRQEEFERMSLSSRGSTGRLGKMKTGSTESLRPQDKAESNAFNFVAQASLPTDTAITTPTTPGPKVDVDPHNRRLFQEYREAAAQRKRKSRSIHSGASGPAKFRARMSVIVYYDSDVQSGFESLVRCLASARNTLRKGKNATSYKARMASLAEEESPFDGNRSRTALRNPRVARFGKGSGPFSLDSLSLEQFDLIDKELEVAQTLCEIGAHQFLRDATSSEELAGVREKLLLCLKLAQEGHDLVKDINIDLEPDRPSSTTTTTTTSNQTKNVQVNSKNNEPRTYTDSAMGIEIDDEIEIEIDDEDGISIDIAEPEVETETPASAELDSKKAPQQVHKLTDPDPDPAKSDRPHTSSSDMIEIDGDTSDKESFHIDLTTVRRAR